MTGESPTEPDPRPEGRAPQEDDPARQHSPAAERREGGSAAKRRRRGSDGERREGEADGERGAHEPSDNTASVDPLVAITLSRGQVDHVLRAALGDHAPPSILGVMVGTGFYNAHARVLLSSRYRTLQQNRRLSRSLLAGLLVLSCFPQEGADIGIKDISEQLELNTSTVHRYVLTLVAAGLLERDPDTRRYRLLPA